MSWDTIMDAGLLDAPPTQEQIDEAGLSDEDLKLLLAWWQPPVRAKPTPNSGKTSDASAERTSDD